MTKVDHSILARELDRTHALTCALDRARARDCALDLALALDLDLTRDIDCPRTRAFTDARQRAATLVNALEAAVTGADVQTPTGPAQPARSAGRLADVTVRVLPGPYRSRYRDEFRSELYDLAAGKASRQQQLMYSVRLACRAWHLRTELHDHAPRRTPVITKIAVAFGSAGGGTSVVIMAGWPVVAELGVLAVTVGGFLCWVVSSTARTSRLVKVIDAIRGK